MQSLNSTYIQVPPFQLPTTLLETFIPGFGILSNVLKNALGFDVTAAVSLGLLLFAIIKSVDILRHQILDTLIRYSTSSISFDSNADAYHWIVDYLQVKGVGQSYYDLIAVSNSSANANRDVEYELNGYLMATSKPDDTANAQRNQPKVRYEPAIGSAQWFWHNSHLFIWRRWKESREQVAGFGSPEMVDRIRGRLYCFGTSTGPVKSLVQDAINNHLAKTAFKTTIRRPASSRQRRNGINTWEIVTTRPSRSLTSVILDDQEKTRIVDDMTEFLSSETKRWYADRGIPYRRGYLLNGPPGTGKTSLTFALAGVFDLEIYCISLAEATMTEEDLAKLFDNLPERCIVLLEDIDVAGLTFRADLSQGNLGPRNNVHQRRIHEEELIQDEEPRKTASGSSRISLSGLLNVIDGVAASEGRLLFMTTNNVSGLDQALLRPGRIDLILQFSLASQRDAKALFLQIFKRPSFTGSASSSTQPKTQSHELLDTESLASMFARKIRPGQIGQAEIQGYLMLHKNDATRALEEADGWLARRHRVKSDDSR